jgi:putative endonuclease
MFKVYILKNNLTGKHYIGSTNDLVRRIAEHNRGQTKSTKRKGIWKIIYTEDYDTALGAKRRERLIKSYKGGNAFKKLLRA